MKRQTTGMSYWLKDKQSIQQITRPRMGKKRKPACNTLILYQLLFSDQYLISRKQRINLVILLQTSSPSGLHCKSEHYIRTINSLGKNTIQSKSI